MPRLCVCDVLRSYFGCNFPCVRRVASSLSLALSDFTILHTGGSMAFSDTRELSHARTLNAEEGDGRQREARPDGDECWWLIGGGGFTALETEPATARERERQRKGRQKLERRRLVARLMQRRKPQHLTRQSRAKNTRKHQLQPPKTALPVRQNRRR